MLTDAEIYYAGSMLLVHNALRGSIESAMHSIGDTCIQYSLTCHVGS